MVTQSEDDELDDELDVVDGADAEVDEDESPVLVGVELDVLDEALDAELAVDVDFEPPRLSFL